ncbi:MAG: glycosyltransferase [Methanobacteriaceae archaeon]|nr:glycosyltransferase [Methanobacteriaceae archaeon]
MKKEKNRFITKKGLKEKFRLFNNFLYDNYKLILYQKSTLTSKNLKNQLLFKNKKEIKSLKINQSILKKHNPKIAFAVSESNENTAAGDYFTAMELGEALKKLGWEVEFLPRKGSGYWYAIDKDVDVILSLLDSYDPRKIKTSNKNLIKIAWLRNWFPRWISNPGFYDYNIIFANSKIACDYVESKTGQKCNLLPIATNINRFNDKVSPKKEYECDYCFTGSYWNDPRDIIKILDPDCLPYKFNLYGKNWDKFDKFKKYYKGFVNYYDVPKIYASTKIVIDDANRVTKGYGAVNSRVFDALASGVLVLTNGELGSNGTFDGKLPVFSSKDELNELIIYYLENDSERISKIKELQRLVLKYHNYLIRAFTVIKVIDEFITK